MSAGMVLDSDLGSATDLGVSELLKLCEPRYTHLCFNFFCPIVGPYVSCVLVFIFSRFHSRYPCLLICVGNCWG